MKTLLRSGFVRLAVMLLLGVASSQADAERHGHGKHHERSAQPLDDYAVERDDGEHDDHQTRYDDRNFRFFNDDHRHVIRDYYGEEYRGGRCPPGLAKKHNGCQPPGQVKRWAIGRPLPRDVVYYELPPTIVQRIGYPPAGYRLVRVASDVLLIAIGTGMVIDALGDMGAW